MPYARIAVHVPTVSGLFDYSIPADLEEKLRVGHLVTIPFGKQTVQGVVTALTATAAVAETKPILGLLDPLPVLTPAQLALADWMADYFLASRAAMLDLMLPAGLSQQADTVYQVVDGKPETPGVSNSPVQRRLVDLLHEKGPLRGRQIDRHFKNVDWRKPAQHLVRTGALTSRSILPAASVRPKFVRTAQLAVPPTVAEAALPGLGRTAETLKRRQAALRFLLREPADVNVSWVYAESGCSLADLQELAERELILLRETEIWRDPLGKIDNIETPKPEIVLTPEQERAWGEIAAAFDASSPTSPFLLHGVTGSGKTEIYIRGAREAIRRGRQAILLVPEIALTPQTVRRFMAHFPGQVGLLHSRLSDGERYDTWRRARLGTLKVIIGPRSALFAPLPDVGFIGVDECHDGSYYQSEPPFYSAVQAAVEYARLRGAACVLGSATPPIVLRQQAGVGESLRLLELPERVEGRSMPPVRVVDMREELKSGNRGIFSTQLAEALGDVLRKGEQAILFLNRRGTATYVFCRECGQAIRCPRCDAPLTQHLDGQAANLRCHRCGYQRQVPKVCPNCGSGQIRAYGLGSEKVEAEVQALFPAARTLRWDWETTRRKDAHEIILSHFVAGRADVLVGTQMLAKGLDLPRVTLVGIVLAEVGMNLPDPFAAERTFAVLTQVAGRAGRSSLGGRVVLQTFQPEHYAIRAAAGHDYAAFYDRELEYRRRLGYPPFGRLVRLETREGNPARAEAEARRLAEKIQAWLEVDDRRQTTLIGPAPCFFSRLNGVYRWQIVLRGPDPASLLRDKNLSGWRVEVDPPSLL
ncbi:MAG TPA: primosomal protein N' [Anaerolineales bacterium]|nr:primosomal protein N' [Anaerolineales bacterium]